MKNAGKKLAIGTVFAAAAGYMAGILTAPKSGKETRQDIKNTAEHALVEGEKQLKKLHTELNLVINETRVQAVKLKGEAKKKYDEAVKAAQDAKEKARVLLSALHEGDTDDKDLKVAVDEAKKALDHLKTYLKKEA